ncbi:hypothetical protein [Blastococcus sp. SYSU DS0619]
MRTPAPGQRARAVLAVTAVGLSSSVFALAGVAQAAPTPTWSATLAGPTGVIPPGICSVDWKLQGGSGGGGAFGGLLVVNTPVAEGASFDLFPGAAGGAAVLEAGGAGGLNGSTDPAEAGADGGTADTGGTGAGGGGAASAVYTAGNAPALFLYAFGGDGAPGAMADTTSIPGGAGGGGDFNTAATVALDGAQASATATATGDGTITGTGVPCDVPAAPTGLTVDPGDGLLSVSFTPAADAGAEMSDVDGWEISTDNGATWVAYSPADFTDVGGVLSRDISGLVNGQTYDVVVRATSVAGPGTATAAVTGTPQAAAVPAAPTLKSVEGRDGFLIVTITPTVDAARPDATGYEYSTDDGSSWAPFSATPDGADLVGDITGLDNGTGYQVRVRGTAGALQGDPSAPMSGLPAGAPSAPTDVAIVAGDGQLTVTFKQGADPGAAMADPSGWEISTDGGSSFGSLAVVVESTGMRATQTGLTNGTAYQVVLRATSAVGAGLPSVAVTGTPAAPVVAPPSVPDAPHLSYALPLDKGIELNFFGGSPSGAPAATGFEYRLNGGAWTSLSASIVTGDWWKAAITGLTNGTTYTVELRAIGGTAGELASAASNSATATPRYVLPAPEDLAVAVRPGALKVTWKAPVGAVGLTGYEVHALPGEDPQSDAGLVSCATGPAVTECVLPVVAGQPYSVMVVGVSAEGLGDGVAVVSDVVPAVQKPAAVPTQDDGDLRGANGPIESAKAGEKLVLTGSGFLPGSTVELIVYSTPISLGSVIAGPDGTFTATVTLPEDLAVGTHHLVATGVDQFGNVRNLVIDVTVDAAGAGTVTQIRDAGLASTGADVALPLAGGAAALLLGGGLLVASRRRANA